MGSSVGRYLTAVWHGEGKQQEHMYISVDLAQVPLLKEREQIWFTLQ